MTAARLRTKLEEYYADEGAAGPLRIYIPKGSYQLSGCMDPKASNYKSYYVHRDDAKCVFGGAAAR